MQETRVTRLVFPNSSERKWYLFYLLSQSIGAVILSDILIEEKFDL